MNHTTRPESDYEVASCFGSVQGEGQNFLEALFKKLVALPPPPLNNDTYLRHHARVMTYLG